MSIRSKLQSILILLFVFIVGLVGMNFFTFNEHAAVLDVLDQLDLPRYSNRFSQPLSELEYA